MSVLEHSAAISKAVWLFLLSFIVIEAPNSRKRAIATSFIQPLPPAMYFAVKCGLANIRRAVSPCSHCMLGSIPWERRIRSTACCSSLKIAARRRGEATAGSLKSTSPAVSSSKSVTSRACLSGSKLEYSSSYGLWPSTPHFASTAHNSSGTSSLLVKLSLSSRTSTTSTCHLRVASPRAAS